jgi:hypothetical protein
MPGSPLNQRRLKLNNRSIENGSEKIFGAQQMATDRSDNPSTLSSVINISLLPNPNPVNAVSLVQTGVGGNASNVASPATLPIDKPTGLSTHERQWNHECSVEMEIISDPHFLITCLRDRVIGQKRCDRESQFVILMDTHVIKGPYLHQHITEIFDRKDFFVHWQTPHVVLPDEVIMSTCDGYFLRYPNLAQNYSTKYRWHTEKFKTLLPSMSPPRRETRETRSSASRNSAQSSNHPVTGSPKVPKEEARRLQYRVLRKNGLISLYDYLDDSNHAWIYGSMPTLLLALIHCYILRIGDMCFSNILVDIKKRQLYLIDLDDTLEHDRNDEFFYFRGRPYPSKATEWIQQARPHYPWLIEQLGHLISKSPPLKHRIRNAIFRLARYVYTPEPEESSESSSSSDSSDTSSSSSDD